MNWDVLLSAPWHIQLHVVAALSALGLGIVQFSAPKGTIPHRTLGYIWIALMFATATTAIFIRNINDGSFSWIHIFVPLVVYSSIELAIRARRGLTDRHRRSAQSFFIGALLIPGAFSFLPERLMWQVIMGS